MTDPDVIVTAIQFGEGVISIQYAERRKQAHVGGVVENITFDTRYIADDVDEIQENAVDLVDVCLRLIQNPPKEMKDRGGEEWLAEAAALLKDRPEDDD